MTSLPFARYSASMRGSRRAGSMLAHAGAGLFADKDLRATAR